MREVFLSYKAEDRARVAPLVAALEADGLSVWWDGHIVAGDEWRDTILQHLEAAGCAIIVWSKRSVGGRFVRDEASRALRRGIYLPVRIDKVEPPLGFGETQALNLQGWKGNRDDSRYQAVLAAARGRLGISGAPETANAKRPLISRRAMVAGGAAVVVAAAGAGTWLISRPAAASDSIAVLPFANLSGDPAQAYFSDGLAEELRSALSRIAGLKVVARTSSEAVGDADAKSAAAKLGVTNILTGSVRRSPRIIRVSAQLIDGRQGIERWSETYDRTAGDALQIQSDIAGRVADALSIRLANRDRRRLAEGGTANPDAHDLLLKAQAENVRARGPDAVERAIGLIDAALALDPNYGDAAAAKAELLRLKAGSFSPTAALSQQTYRLAEATARRAIQLAPQSRLGYSVLANVLDQQLRRRAALATFGRMLEIPGNEAETLPSYAVFLSEIGRREDALRAADRAVAVDPLNPMAHGHRATVLANARRYREALAELEEIERLRAGLPYSRALRGFCYMMLGNNQRARAEFDSPRPGYSGLSWRGALAAREGNFAEAGRILAEIKTIAADAAHFQYAEILAQMGRKDEAIAELERAFAARDPGLTMITVNPLLDPLRGDARFEALVRRLDFP